MNVVLPAPGRPRTSTIGRSAFLLDEIIMGATEESLLDTVSAILGAKSLPVVLIVNAVLHRQGGVVFESFKLNRFGLVLAKLILITSGGLIARAHGYYAMDEFSTTNALRGDDTYSRIHSPFLI